MEGGEQIDKPLHDLIEIIQFTENVSAKIDGALDEAEICRIIKEEFAKSKRYTASILLLTDDGSKLRIAETSLAAGKLSAGEKASGVRLKEYKIDLNKSSIYSRVVREGKTVQVNVSETVGELFPRPLAYLISKVMDYEKKKKKSILTPLKRHGKIIGAFGMSSTDLAEYFTPSVRNLAQHISAALELAYEYGERKQAEETLRENEGRFRELAELLPQVVFEIDERGNFIFANLWGLEVSGYTQEDIDKGLNALQLFIPEDRDRVKKNIQRILSGERLGGNEYTALRKDGSTFSVIVYSSPIIHEKTCGSEGYCYRHHRAQEDGGGTAETEA